MLKKRQEASRACRRGSLRSRGLRDFRVETEYTWKRWLQRNGPETNERLSRDFEAEKVVAMIAAAETGWEVIVVSGQRKRKSAHREKRRTKHQM